MEPALKIIKIFPKTFTTDGIFIEHLLMPNIFYFTHIQKKWKEITIILILMILALCPKLYGLLTLVTPLNFAYILQYSTFLVVNVYTPTYFSLFYFQQP